MEFVRNVDVIGMLPARYEPLPTDPESGGEVAGVATNETAARVGRHEPP